MSCSGSHLGITINIKNTKFVKDLPMIDARLRKRNPTKRSDEICKVRKQNITKRNEIYEVRKQYQMKKRTNYVE
jgi:hypothetical protein